MYVYACLLILKGHLRSCMSISIPCWVNVVLNDLTSNTVLGVRTEKNFRG